LHIAILSFTDLARDQRVNRQIRFLAERHRVTAIGGASPNVPGVDFVPASILPRSVVGRAVTVAQMLLKLEDSRPMVDRFGREVLARLEALDADLFVANDLEPLPLALSVAKGRPVVLDAHEYYPRRYEDRLSWRYLRNPYNAWLCQRLFPRTDAVMTVCQGLAEQYDCDTGIRPLVITNAPEHADLCPVYRKNGEPIRMVYHGLASTSRRIEETMALMAYLDGRFSLDMYLVPGDEAYISRLRRLAEKDTRITVCEPMPADEIISRTHGYDIGVFLLPPTSFSYLHALPNKFFEFVQARLAVAVGPSPEMASLVHQFDLGVVASDYSAQRLASALVRLDHDAINAYKAHADAAARTLSAEANKTALLELVEQVFQQERQP